MPPLQHSVSLDQIVQEARQLADTQVTITVSLPELWQLIAHIQLGLKHPGARHSLSAMQVRDHIEVWTAVLEANGAPAMAQAIREGWGR